jgi:hypothetical protein
MTNTPAVRLALAGLLALASLTHAHAQGAKYTPQQMLDPSLAPKHDDVAITTPTADELKGCTVVLVQGANQSSGFVLLDAKKQPVRRFFASKGASVDVWSYFKDGVEVYREFDTTGKGAPNNFRWLNAGGMKWGVGYVTSGKAVITTWRMISAEEAAQEAYQAVAKDDLGRLQALLINDAEMNLIKLPATKAKAIQATQASAKLKFADLVKEAKLGGMKFDGVESAIPQCDASTDDILIKHASRAIRFMVNDKQHGWIHTGEMIQVGMAWRLTDVPTTKDPVHPTNDNANPKQVAEDPKLDKLQKDLANLDADPPAPDKILAKNAKIDAYYRKRIDMIQQILPLDKAGEREGWYKQLFDNLAAMAQNSGDQATLAHLYKLKDDVVAGMPNTNLAAYGAFRCYWTDYTLVMGSTPPPSQAVMVKTQEKWLENLADFVKKYPKAEDTPDALNHLATGTEVDGKIEEAKRWYKHLVDEFPMHHSAPRAKGSLARLSLVGNEMALSAPLLADSSKTLAVSQLKGKVVIVHYWGSYSDDYQDDFAKLSRILKDASSKNIELVNVNLDPDEARAKAAVAKVNAPGTHLFQANNNAPGLSSPLATQYGIQILPTIFVIGRDGRVTNNAVQIGDLESELKKVQ